MDDIFCAYDSAALIRMAIVAFAVSVCVLLLCLTWIQNTQRLKITKPTRGKTISEKIAPAAPQLIIPDDDTEEGESMTEKQSPAEKGAAGQPEAPKMPEKGLAETKPTAKEASAATKAVTSSGTMQNKHPQIELDRKLMPPPAKPTTSNLRATPTTTQSLRVPSNGPLPNRLPPPKSSLSGGSSLSVASVSTLPPNKRSSKKVQLSPGHSPLDWADKTRSENLSGVPFLQRITPSQLKTQTGRKGKPAWSSYKGRVYNIGPYLPFHPGGEDQLMKAAGRDGAKLFEEVHPWVNWDNMMESCLVGFLVPEETTGEDLEGLD